MHVYITRLLRITKHPSAGRDGGAGFDSSFTVPPRRYLANTVHQELIGEFVPDMTLEYVLFLFHVDRINIVRSA